jgi:DNA-binding transcriptional LysR family regulator
MDINHLRTFVEVARRGSFASAARALDLSPPQVTRLVAALEAELGVRLLHRTTRKTVLTDAGAAYVAQAESVVEQLDQAAEELHAADGQLRGSVRLTASVAFAKTVLAPLLARLHTALPLLQVELIASDAVLDLVAERIDLAVRLGDKVDPSLVGARLRPVRYRVCASPRYLDVAGRPRKPADLAHCDCLRFAVPGHRTVWRFRDGAQQAEQVAVSGWLVSTSALVLHEAALDGLGPALLPDWLINNDLAAGRLADVFPRLEVSAAAFDTAVWLLAPARRFTPRRVAAVRDFLRQEIGHGSSAARR